MWQSLFFVSRDNAAVALSERGSNGFLFELGLCGKDNILNLINELSTDFISLVVMPVDSILRKGNWAQAGIRRLHDQAPVGAKRSRGWQAA